MHKQDSAEVLSEDISESTETPTARNQNKSKIGMGVSAQRDSNAANKTKKHVIMKPKVIMYSQNSLMTSGSSVSLQLQQNKSQQ